MYVDAVTVSLLNNTLIVVNSRQVFESIFSVHVSEVLPCLVRSDKVWS